MGKELNIHSFSTSLKLEICDLYIHRVAIDYTDNSSQHNIILFHCAAIQISLDPLTYLEKELTIDTYVTLRGNTSAPIQENTEIHIRDLGSGNASGTCMV